MTQTLAPSFCANCGAQVTNAGRAQADGKRFCRAKSCQAAKARLYRANLARFKPEREAPSTCGCCGRKLPARDWRAGDELGRWCSRVKCRAERDRVRTETGLADMALMIRKADHAEVVIAFLQEAIMADAEDYYGSARVACRQCGLTTAIPGWPHPTATNGGCLGTLGDQKARNIGPQGLVGAWPFRREYLTADEIADLAD